MKELWRTAAAWGTALALLSTAPAPACAVRGKRQQHSQRRKCSKEEDTRDFLRRATGDEALLQLGPPDCEPQALDDEMTEVRGVRLPALALQERQLAAQGTKNSSERLVHFVVHQSHAAWCAPPCDSPSWELALPKAEELGHWGGVNDYTVYEIAIWQQLGKITAYQFDASWMKSAKNAFNEVCAGTGWNCPAYTTFRESKAVYSCPSAIIARDFKEDSSTFAQKLEGLLNCLRERAGGGRVALTYVGHGSDGSGGLFESSIKPKDGKALVAAQNFVVLNFGTNCVEGRWSMVRAFATGAPDKPRYILASDLEVGGYKDGLSQGMGDLLLAAKTKLSFASSVQTALAQAVSSGTFLASLRQNLVSVVQQRQQFWQEIASVLKLNNLHQSLSLYDAAKPFADLSAALKTAYENTPKKGLLAALNRSRADCCDVRQFILALKAGSTELEKTFENFRIGYVSSRSVGVDPVFQTYGFAFDIIGAPYLDPDPSPRWQIDLGIGHEEPQLAPPWFGGANVTGGTGSQAAPLRLASLASKRRERQGQEAPECSPGWGEDYTCDLGPIA